MNIIEYIKNNFKIPSGIIYTLFIICTVSQLFNTAIAETTSVEKDKDSWYDGTWLDGSWIPQSVQIHGFISQGMTTTTANNFFGESNGKASFDYREIGLNGSWRVIPELQLSMQILYRDAGLTDEKGVRIDYGFADYSFYSTESTLLGIKAGRVPTPFGFYNETRDVLSTRPSIILPQSIYFDVNRDLAISADGGYLYGEQRTEFGDFFINAGVVVPRTDDVDFKHGIVGTAPGKMEGDTSWVTRLNYEWQSGLIRLAITYGDFKAHFEPDPIPGNLPTGTFRLNPLIFSAQYNSENWSLTAEYELRRIRTTGFGFPSVDQRGESFYVQGTYKFTSFLEGLVRYDQLIWNVDDKYGEQFEAQTGLPAYSRYAKDWTFGLRLKIIPSIPNLLLSGEYHYVEGTGWLSGVENPDPSKTSKYWSLYMLMISYDF